MKGFILSVPQKYEELALRNVLLLRHRFRLDHPIEIWEAGQDISDEVRAQFSRIPGLVFRNVEEVGEDPAFWKGFQIKALMCRFTRFDEFVLVDADATFVQNPKKIWNSRGYRKTGSYFFRDLTQWKFHDLSETTDEKFMSAEYVRGRIAWLKGLLPHRSPFFPKEWSFVYEQDLPTRPVLEAYMESGVVFLNKAFHHRTVQVLFDLNKNHAETYRWIWGDKETFWIACCIAEAPYTMNSQPPYMAKKLIQPYRWLPFYYQK